MAGNPLGQGPLGIVRYGDEQTGGVLPRSSAMGITYTIAQSQHGVAMGITYTVQAPNTAILQIYYLVAPPEGFSINGDGSIIWPDQVTYPPKPVVGRTLLASPIIQGYKTVVWTYSLLQEPEAAYLQAFYNPQSPIVTITYPDDRGVWVQRQVAMLPPIYGTRETVSVANMVLTFLLLHES